MKRKISLKWFVALVFLMLAAGLIIGYSLLSARFFIRGMHNVTAATMAQVVKSYVRSIPAAQRQHLNHFSGYQISPDWRQLPEKIQQTFKEPEKTGILLVHDDRKLFSPPDEILFVMRVPHGSTAYFISRSTTRKTAPPMVGRKMSQNIQLLVAISLFIALSIAASIWLMLKHVERPVSALGQWARQLNANNLDEAPPDFSYPELNELAALIRTSLSSVQESLEREHRFLRHSSHELRTPISIIRNNIELLHKHQENSGNKWEPRKAQIIERIDRASLTMKQLTETLLWLSRESDVPLSAKELDMERLVRDVIEEARYLLKDKPVEIIIETAPHTVRVAEIPARIVIHNLIRNAFQHTWQGTIRITQQNGTVDIVNDTAKENGNSEDMGFGLGLQLIEQLTARLNWPYSIITESERHRARVCIA
jgi:signal transduction histidine kinase